MEIVSNSVTKNTSIKELETSVNLQRTQNAVLRNYEIITVRKEWNQKTKKGDKLNENQKYVLPQTQRTFDSSNSSDLITFKKEPLDMTKFVSYESSNAMLSRN